MGENRKIVYDLFTEINKRELCSVCKKEREMFKDVDTKFGQYSNLSLGFISEEILEGDSMFDVMIVLESHGGGEKNQGFRPEQWDTHKELQDMKKYYLHNNIVKFHQKQIRILLNHLDQMGFTYVATDLIKCFVKKGKSKNRDFTPNFQCAITHCKNYLKEQIFSFKPKVIISLGNSVSSDFFGMESAKHGDVWEVNIVGSGEGILKNENGSMENPSTKIMKRYVIHSIFPSRNTADYWVKDGEWEPIIERINLILSSS